jgi:hypothetical protein
MPGTWRVRVIEERLRSEGIRSAVVERDIYSLQDKERHAVLDVMVGEHADLPMVVVDGVVACCDGFDLDAVVRVAREAGRR